MSANVLNAKRLFFVTLLSLGMSLIISFSAQALHAEHSKSDVIQNTSRDDPKAPDAPQCFETHDAEWQDASQAEDAAKSLRQTQIKQAQTRDLSTRKSQNFEDSDYSQDSAQDEAFEEWRWRDLED